jgi:peptide deformylase
MLDEKLDNLEIIHWPDPRLKIAGQRIEVFDQALKLLATRMIDLMNQAQGVGLAATQIGLDLQLFVARSPGQMDQPRVYINSELFEIGGTVSSEEGCLSVPGITTKVRRISKMGIRAQDINGKEFKQEADKLLSRVLQHEFDHCAGMLIVDRMSRLQRIAHRRAIRQLEDAYKPTK